MNPAIKIFPDSICTVDDAGKVSLFEQPPSTPTAHALRWGWLVVLVAFVASWAGESSGLSVGLFSVLVAYPLLAVIVANLIFPRTTYQAHFDNQGLHLAIGHAQNPTADASIFVPYGEITALVLLDQYRNMGRYGTTWFRSYIFTTKQPYGEKPYLQINTKRSVESVYSVLNRVSQLPAAQHIGIPAMITLGNPPLSPHAKREERERRLRGEV